MNDEKFEYDFFQATNSIELVIIQTNEISEVSDGVEINHQGILVISYFDKKFKIVDLKRNKQIKENKDIMNNNVKNTKFSFLVFFSIIKSL
nr:hypothetical protein [Metamycoplasma alkalescens]